MKRNSAVFNNIIDFPKPIIVAVNGPAIGAVVTSATLCDAVLAAEEATFSTPFAALGIVPEGCSSVHFERIMGKENAERMLGKEGFKPTAKQAKKIGLITEVVPGDKVERSCNPNLEKKYAHNLNFQLMGRAQDLGEKWIETGRKRWMVERGVQAEYRKINLEESHKLASAFLAPPFLNAQYQFLKKKGKSGPATAFWVAKTLRPIWGRMLPK